MVPQARKVKLICPAKINLSLAILGQRGDGFHALHSVVAQTRFGDELELDWNPSGEGDDCISISGAELDPQGSTPAVALRMFREATGLGHGQFRIHLRKCIPIGAGLGGGSSNGVGVLRALQEVFGKEAAGLDWNGLAAGIGSDCPLFLHQEPVLMEGRGDLIRPLAPELASRFRGRPVILFKPGFSINTGEAYRRLASRHLYHSEKQAREHLQAWAASDSVLPEPLNDFEGLVKEWMPSLAVVLERLGQTHGLDARLSGSGSACFVFPNDPRFAISELTKELARAWGSAFWIEETLVN
jgi:4-diphosphocytidyl-2-C-methyl-D-erythritol kinase